MSYAIRKDGKGWRAVSRPDEVGADETFSNSRPALVAPSVPSQVSALQGLKAIAQTPSLAEAYDAWATDPARTFLQRAFINKAQTWERADPTLSVAAAALGLTEAQLDGLFTLAATL